MISFSIPSVTKHSEDTYISRVCFSGKFLKLVLASFDFCGLNFNFFFSAVQIQLLKKMQIMEEQMTKKTFKLQKSI